jgi:hypothetical protein
MRVLGLLALVGCGPSLTTLTKHHHYREAVCAAEDGSNDDRDHVRRALARDADVHVHVALIDEVHLSGVIGPHARELSRRMQLARIQLTTNTLPIDELSGSVDMLGDGKPLTSAVTWETLAAATGEKLPPKRTDSTYLTGGNFLRGVGVFFTFGMSLPFTRFRPQSYEVDAPHHEYERMAPLSTALQDAMHPRGCSPRRGRGGGIGLACTFYVAIDPTASDRDVRLEVEVAYLAKRDRRNEYDWRDERCRVQQRASIPLGRLRELDLRIARMFGPHERPRMRVLRELTFD